MPEIDYALAWDFIDPADGRPRSCGSGRNYEPEILEHAADDLTQARDVTPGQLVDMELGNANVTRRWVLLGEQEPHEGRLARARRADEEDELTLVDLDRDVVERRPSRRLVLLGHLVEGDHHGTPM
jgi:hypothetical protein